MKSILCFLLLVIAPLSYANQTADSIYVLITIVRYVFELLALLAILAFTWYGLNGVRELNKEHRLITKREALMRIFWCLVMYCLIAFAYIMYDKAGYDVLVLEKFSQPGAFQ